MSNDKPYFECTKYWKDPSTTKMNYFCIKFGTEFSCGQIKLQPSYSKQWQGINKFDADHTQLTAKDKNTGEDIVIKGEVGFDLIIKEGGYCNLIIFWEDDENLDTEGRIGRLVAEIFIEGTFECGDDYQLLFKDLKVSDIYWSDLQNGKVANEYTNISDSGVKSFFDTAFKNTKFLKKYGSGNIGTLTGEQIKYDIEKVMI